MLTLCVADMHPSVALASARNRSWANARAQSSLLGQRLALFRAGQRGGDGREIEALGATVELNVSA
jgi:hypothetical protein